MSTNDKGRRFVHHESHDPPKGILSGIVGLMQKNGNISAQCNITQMYAELRSISKLPELVMKEFTNKSCGLIISEEGKGLTDYIEWGANLTTRRFHGYKELTPRGG